MKAGAIHSAALSALCAFFGWVGWKTQTSAEQISGLVVLVQSRGEILQRLDVRLSDAVPRREFDARVLQLELRLREIDLELVRLRR